jgi:carbonic anhydrase
MDAVLEELKAGIRRFRTEVYPADKETYVKAFADCDLCRFAN